VDPFCRESICRDLGDQCKLIINGYKGDTDR